MCSVVRWRTQSSSHQRPTRIQKGSIFISLTSLTAHPSHPSIKEWEDALTSEFVGYNNVLMFIGFKASAGLDLF